MKRRDFLATSSVSLAALAVSDAGLNNVIAGEAATLGRNYSRRLSQLWMMRRPRMV